LTETCLKLWDHGATGALISGGCDSSGKLDFKPFYDALSKIKKNTGLILNLHTGLLGEEEIAELSRINVDVVSFDLVLDKNVIRNVYHLNYTPEDYLNCLKGLLEADIRVVPHICIGLNPDAEDNDVRSLDAIKEFELKRLIFIIFIPTKGTKMEAVLSPSVESVSKYISHAKEIMPKTELVLGCMRPRRPERYELTAVSAGVNGIVLPSQETLKILTEKGWVFNRFEECCSIIRNAEIEFE
jgi:uncharacterized radical SAM superfamily protein